MSNETITKRPATATDIADQLIGNKLVISIEGRAISRAVKVTQDGVYARYNYAPLRVYLETVEMAGTDGLPAMMIDDGVILPAIAPTPAKTYTHFVGHWA